MLLQRSSEVIKSLGALFIRREVNKDEDNDKKLVFRKARL